MMKLFPIIFVAVFALIHYTIYRLSVKNSHFSQKTKRVLSLFLLINFLMVVGYMTTRYAIEATWWLYFIFSLSIGVGFVLFLGSLIHEVFIFSYRHIPLEPKRRAFIRRIGDIGFFSLGTLYTGVALENGLSEPTIKSVQIANSNLKNSYRFAQISDMHIGGLIGEEFVSSCVDRINSLDVDAVFITGDLTDATVEKIKSAIAHLANLKSRLGTFMVLGNHEYFHGADKTIQFIESIGIRVLKNESIEFDDFWVVGVHDLIGKRVGFLEPDIKKATSSINNNKPTLLLAHQPKFTKYLEGFEPSLMLSGHTHGGQIFPFGLLVRAEQGFVKGLYEVGKTKLYVNSGIGFWGPPMRLGSSAEIALIEWRS